MVSPIIGVLYFLSSFFFLMGHQKSFAANKNITPKSSHSNTGYYQSNFSCTKVFEVQAKWGSPAKYNEIVHASLNMPLQTPIETYYKEITDSQGCKLVLRDLGGLHQYVWWSEIESKLKTISGNHDFIKFYLNSDLESQELELRTKSRDLSIRLYEKYEQYYSEENLKELSKFPFLEAPSAFVRSDDMWQFKHHLELTRQDLNGNRDLLATISLFKPTEFKFIEASTVNSMAFSVYPMFTRMAQDESKRVQKTLGNFLQGRTYGEISRYLQFKKMNIEEKKLLLGSLLQLAESHPFPVEVLIVGAYDKLAIAYRLQYGFKKLLDFTDEDGNTEELLYMEIGSESHKNLKKYLNL